MPAYRPKRPLEALLKKRRAASVPRDKPEVPPGGIGAGNVVPPGLAERVQLEVDARMGSLERDLLEQIHRYAEDLATTTVAADRKIPERAELPEKAATIPDPGRAAEASPNAARVDDAVGAIDQLVNATPSSPPSPLIPLVPKLWNSSSAPSRSQVATTETRYVCPNCGSNRIARRDRDTFYEEFLRLFFIQPLRCRRCFRRFMSF